MGGKANSKKSKADAAKGETKRAKREKLAVKASQDAVMSAGARQWRSTTRSLVKEGVVVFAVAAMCVSFLRQFYVATAPLVVPAAADRPLLSVRRDVFGVAVAAAVRSCAVNATADGRPLVASFGDVRALEADPRLRCFAPVVRAAPRAEAANVFRLFVSRCGGSADDRAWRLDETRTRGDRRFAAHSVSAYYADVADGGGPPPLEVARFDERWTAKNAASRKRSLEALDAVAFEAARTEDKWEAPDASGVSKRGAVLKHKDDGATTHAELARAAPAENAMVTFATAFHRVLPGPEGPLPAEDDDGFAAPPSRVVVALEQYVVRKPDAAWAPTLEVLKDPSLAKGSLASCY